MLFSGKKNVFMCLVAFQKIFSDVWLCSWKYHRKHILYLLLTFSHIFSVAKRIYNIIHSSKHKKKKPKKKIIKSGHFARSRLVRRRDRDRRGRCFVRSVDRDRSFMRLRNRSKLRTIAQCVDRDRRWSALCTIGAVPVRSWSLLSFSLSLSLSLFYFPRPEVIWSENRNGNSFPAFWLWNSVNWKCSSVWPNLK